MSGGEGGLGMKLVCLEGRGSGNETSNETIHKSRYSSRPWVHTYLSCICLQFQFLSGQDIFNAKR